MFEEEENSYFFNNNYLDEYSFDTNKHFTQEIEFKIDLEDKNYTNDEYISELKRKGDTEHKLNLSIKEVNIYKQNYEKKIEKNSNRNSKILEKNKRVLILLGNKTKKKISLDQSINKEINSEGSDEKPLGDRKKLRKVSFAKNYWIFLSIKQHIINYFSDIKCCKITESYIPLTMR